jgi:hypothetical protein
MSRKIVVLGILIAILLVPAIYYSVNDMSHEKSYHIDVSEISIGSAGMVINSTNSSTFVNGSPPKIFINIYFHSNMTENVSWVYITTTEFTLEYWTYHNDSHNERWNTTRTPFCGTLPAGNASVLSVQPKGQEPYLTLCAVPDVYTYTGYISVHIVFKGIPGDEIY